MGKLTISYDHTTSKLTEGLLVNGEPMTLVFNDSADIRQACFDVTNILEASGKDEFSLELLTQLSFSKNPNGEARDLIMIACGMGHVSVLGSDALQEKLARQLIRRTMVDQNKSTTFERFAEHCINQVVPEEVPEGVDIDDYKAVMSIIVWNQLLVTMGLEAKRKKGSTIF